MVKHDKNLCGCRELERDITGRPTVRNVLCNAEATYVFEKGGKTFYCCSDHYSEAKDYFGKRGTKL